MYYLILQHSTSLISILTECSFKTPYLYNKCIYSHTIWSFIFIFGITITGNGIAECLSYFSSCSLKKATKGGEGLFWLIVQEYNPSWQGSYRSWRQPVTIEPQFRVESDTWWMFLFVHSFFLYSSGNSATHRVVLAPQLT